MVDGNLRVPRQAASRLEEARRAGQPTVNPVSCVGVDPRVAAGPRVVAGDAPALSGAEPESTSPDAEPVPEPVEPS